MTKFATHVSKPKTTILAVSGSPSELNLLHCLFAGSSWAVCTAGTLAEAGEQLQRSTFPVVLCERHLPDGDWRGLLRITNQLSDPPSVIVCSRHADDELWSAALNAGAFDVLRGASNQREVFRTLNGAWRSWKERNRPACACA